MEKGNLIARARSFAIERHEAVQHKRKYTGEPYWHHLSRVADLVANAGGTSNQVAAAWLHDTVEDTETSLEEINVEFGLEICQMVSALTDRYTKEEGNRAWRKGMEAKRVAAQSPEVKTIKLADLIDNSESILEHDRHFAPVFIRELRELLFALEGGNAKLLARVRCIAGETKERSD